MFALVIGLLISFNQTARAQACVTNPVVVNVLDSGAGTLRQAVIDSCAGSIITFSASMPPEVSLTTGQIVIGKNLTIQGPGANRLTVRNGASSRIFQVNTGVTAIISGLTVEDGTDGGISNAGTLTVADCVIRSNKGEAGIGNGGNLTVVNSVLSDNKAGVGGAIYNSGTAAITNSTILHNSAKMGGGIYNTSNVTITNSSITGNTATGEFFINKKVWGSAITNQNGRVTITNSTIAGNDDEGFASTNCYFMPDHFCRSGYGPEISMLISAQGGSGGDLSLINSTVTDNILIHQFSNAPYSVTARNSIINGLWGFESFATLNSQGNNLIVTPDGHNVLGDTTGNILGVNPRLGPLGYYGGSTMTYALLTGSPAINAGNTATSPATDQRGASRVGAADIGAFELNNSTNGGNFVVQLPDAFTEIAYSQLLVESTSSNYSLTGGALPIGISLSASESYRVRVGGRTAQTGVFAFSVTASDGTNSFVTDYRLRVLPSGAPPVTGCLSNVVVANKSDAGEGSLRQAVIDACAGGTITFGEAARGKIHLTGGPIKITKNLTIAGPGADALTLRSAVGSEHQNNVLVNSGATAVISGLTVSDGFGLWGGGIQNSGNLTVRNVVLRNNRGIYSGGGIANYGTLTLDRTLVTGNGSSGDYAYDRRVFGFEGGGIRSDPNASLTINDSTVSGNNADQGGGIYAHSATITNSTISDNRAINRTPMNPSYGGGIYLDFDGMMALTNCTVSQNFVGNPEQSEGGGIYNYGGTVSLINTTVANNAIYTGYDRNSVHGAGIAIAFAALGTVNARNSIIAGNTVTYNSNPSSTSGVAITTSAIKQFYGELTSQGYNLIGSTNGAQIIGDTTGNIVAADPRLSPLGYYGGPTQTQALLTGSPAINAGNTATSPNTDQRGASRVGTADIGAFELNNSSNGGAFVAQLPDGFVQTPYNYTVADFSVSDGRGNSTNDNTYKYSYTVTGGALPNGISLSTTFSDSGFNERENVKISGTTNQTGIFNFSVTATSNLSGISSVTNYRLQILALPGGSFDSADCNTISGWAWDPQQPNAPVSVNIYADNSLVGSVSANQFRQDLLDAGIGNGVHGFSFATPANLKDGLPHQIRVLIVSTMSDINGSPKTITCAAPSYSISGTVRYGIPDINQAFPVVVGVNLNAAVTSALSDGSGVYQLSNLLDGNYTVTPSKTGEVKGINSMDATRIQQHLVGLTTLTPNQLIAADTDGSGAVNSLDAARIQQRLVGITAPNIIGQWKFVPASKQYNSISGNITGEDYQAVLVGEVSGNWATAASFADDSETNEEILPKQDVQSDTAGKFDERLSQQTADRMNQSDDSESNEFKSESAIAGGVAVNVSLSTNASVSTGSSITIPVTIGAVSAGTPIESFDFTVFYDPAVLQPASPAGSNTGTLSANCSVLANSPTAGRIVVSGACATAITTASGGVLYNLNFNVIGTSGQQTGLLFNNPVTGTQTFQFNSGNPAANTTNGLFTVLGPTAASVSVSGKVTNNQGRGIRNVLITMTDSAGKVRTAQTTSFGYYKFESVAAGETVIITAKARRFRFVQSSIVRTTNESVVNADFVSQQ